MKKIKENIDLKKLEKYGYEKDIYYIKHTKDTYYGHPIIMVIDSCTRIIYKCYCWTYEGGPIIKQPIVRNGKRVKPDKYIEDLIKAGYVEDFK